MEKIPLKEQILHERKLVAKNRVLRMLLLIIASFFTLMDVIKTDAYNHALLDYFFPDVAKRNAKEIASLFVTNEVLLAIVQMFVVGLTEQYVLPSAWCLINFSCSMLVWFYFSDPHLGLIGLLVVFGLRSLNVRYSMIVHWFGDNYCKYTIAVQFFIAVFPNIIKLPIFYWYRQIVFDCQMLVALAGGIAAVVFFATFLMLKSAHGLIVENKRVSEDVSVEQLSIPSAGIKDGSWRCNLASTLFLAAVYYDFPMFATYANTVLGFDLTYDIVYVHVGLFSVVFSVNVFYNIFKAIFRRQLLRMNITPNERARQMNCMRCFFVLASYIGVIISRVLFLYLQLSQIASFPLLILCSSLAGLGGNIQPLSAEFMFRQRANANRQKLRFANNAGYYQLNRCALEPISEETSCAEKCRISSSVFWRKHSDQIFKWMYVDGRNVVGLFLLLLWLLFADLVGSWWFTTNTLVLLLISSGLFFTYFFSNGRKILVLV